MRSAIPLLLSSVLLGCNRSGPASAPTAPREPMILRAVDGPERDVMRPLLAAGRMPNTTRSTRFGQMIWERSRA